MNREQETWKCCLVLIFSKYVWFIHLNISTKLHSEKLNFGLIVLYIISEVSGYSISLNSSSSNISKAKTQKREQENEKCSG